MRLTLRALLAYMYNVLDPADADQFGEKVQESAVASGLVERIRGITHKTRMNAPRVDAKGLVDDANNVAEYLDSCMPDEQVADFERACINSDLHLAEVSSSYQILTMVLGKAAEIPSHLRQRIYTLPLEVATSHTHLAELDPAERARLKKTIEKVTAAKDGAQRDVTTTSTHAAPTVPDYLRDGAARSRTWLIGAAILILAAIALLIAGAGPMDSTHPIIGWMFTPKVVADNSTPPETVPDKLEETSTDKGEKPDTVTEAQPVAPDKSVETTDDKSTVDVDKAKAKDAATTPPEKTTEVPPPPPPETTEPSTEDSGAKTAKAKTKDLEEKTPAADSKPAAEIDPMDVGRYVSDDQVLVRLDAKSGNWFRYEPRALLTAGERLVALPTYRPQIALAAGVQLTIAGESAVQMEAPLRPGASRLAVDYGRFLIFTLGNAGAQVELNLHGLEGTLVLDDADSAVAIEVRHYLPPGTISDEDARVLVVELFAANGRATWQARDQEPVSIPAHHVLTYVGGSEPQLTGPYRSPAWIDATSLTEIDRLTSFEMQKQLTFDRPIHVQLQELLSDRRVDVRAMAARCLAEIDEFEPIIKELSNPQQKSFWAPEVDALRHATTRGSMSLAKLTQALARVRPAEGETILRLLIGYSAEQLAGSAAADLVEMLESPEMDIRVLASDNLRQITGAQLLYRPERRPDDPLNRVPITKWKERLKEESIEYKAAPSPLPERVPLEEPAEPTKVKGKNGKAKAEPAIEEPAAEPVRRGPGKAVPAPPKADLDAKEPAAAAPAEEEPARITVPKAKPAKGEEE